MDALVKDPLPFAFPLVVVCVSGNPRSYVLLRATKRYAERIGVPWMALHIETKKSSLRFVEENRKELISAIKNLTLAEELGAMTSSLYAPMVEDGIAQFVTQKKAEGFDVKALFVGDTSGVPRSTGAVSEHKSTSPFILRLKRLLPVGQSIQPIQITSHYPAKKLKGLHFSLRDFVEGNLLNAVCAVGAVAGATLLILLLQGIFPEVFQSRNRAPIYLIALALVASRSGLIISLATAFASYMAMTYYFTDPSHNLTIDNFTEAAGLILFMIFAGVVALFVSARRDQVDRLLKELKRFQALFNVYKNSVKELTYESALHSIHRDITTALNTEIVFCFPSTYQPEKLIYTYPEKINLSEDDDAACNSCWEDGRPTGFGMHIHPKSAFRFKPLVTSTADIGVIGIRITRTMDLNPAMIELLSSVADLVALILERITIEQKMEENRVEAEREKLRSMLLSSVSHDLKTPLASIIGSLSVHQNMFAALPEEQRQELLANALDEAYRLDSFITNILDMTRLESKQVKFRKEWIPPQDILRHVEKRMKERLRFHKLNIHYDTMMNVELCADVMMTEQVIQNLLDNAGKYTPFGTAIDVTLEQAGPDLVIRIRDYGPGIPDDSIEKIFDKYTRLKKRDAKIAGTGLGLAIARTIMHEQCGDIIVANHPDGGAIFNVIVRNWRKKEDNKEKEEAA